MKQGKYTVVGGKYVHSSALAMVYAKQVVAGIAVAVVVAVLSYMASFCI